MVGNAEGGVDFLRECTLPNEKGTLATRPFDYK